MSALILLTNKCVFVYFKVVRGTEISQPEGTGQIRRQTAMNQNDFHCLYAYLICPSFGNSIVTNKKYVAIGHTLVKKHGRFKLL